MMYHLTPVRMAIIKENTKDDTKKKETTNKDVKAVKKLKLFHVVDGNCYGKHYGGF